MMWDFRGLKFYSHPAHVQTMGSSSLPTSREFRRAIWCLKGRETARQRRAARTRKTGVLIL